MRVGVAPLLAISLLVSGTFASANETSPLPAGKPAGAKQAALLGPSFLLVLISAGVIIGGIGLAASGNRGSNKVVTTTTATSTLP